MACRGCQKASKRLREAKMKLIEEDGQQAGDGGLLSVHGRFSGMKGPRTGPDTEVSIHSLTADGTAKSTKKDITEKPKIRNAKKATKSSDKTGAEDSPPETGSE